MPFHLYADKSFVVWGNEDYLVAGDQRHGAWGCWQYLGKKVGGNSGCSFMRHAGTSKIPVCLSAITTRSNEVQASTRASCYSETTTTSALSFGMTLRTSVASTRTSTAAPQPWKAESRLDLCEGSSFLRRTPGLLIQHT